MVLTGLKRLGGRRLRGSSDSGCLKTQKVLLLCSNAIGASRTLTKTRRELAACCA
jgi:hypothetical protein